MKPNEFRSSTPSQSTMDSTILSVTYGANASVVEPSVSTSRTIGPLPRFTATRVGWAGNAPRLGLSSSPSTSVGAGNWMVRVGSVPARSVIDFSGAVHDVRGSPSVAAKAEPSRSATSDAPLANGRPGWASRASSSGDCRVRTVSSGITAVPIGTSIVREKRPSSSGDLDSPLLHRIRSSVSRQPERPGNSWPSSHASTLAPAGVGGSTARCTMETGLGLSRSE